MTMDTLNPLRLDRYKDGPDALPKGTPHTHKPGAAIALIPEGLVEDYRAAELYRMRNMPHLWDDWMRDLVEDARAKAVDSIGTVYDWDCHKCQRAVITHTLNERCPNCGAR